MQLFENKENQIKGHKWKLYKNKLTVLEKVYQKTFRSYINKSG